MSVTINERPVWARKYGNDVRFSGFNRLTQQGYIGIGWSDIGDVTRLDTIAQIRTALIETGLPERSTIAGRDAGVIHAFVNIAQEGDLIACHDQEDGYIHIGRFIGGCIHDVRLHNHFHLLRRVEWLPVLPPGLFSDSLKMLDGRNVFWEISNPEAVIKAYEQYSRFKRQIEPSIDTN